jgi:hypothetical protein
MIHDEDQHGGFSHIGPAVNELITDIGKQVIRPDQLGPYHALDTLSRFVYPEAPTADPIMMIHRNHNGFITFHTKDDDGTFENLFAVPANELSTYFPGFLPDLDQNSFYSVNGYYKGIGKSKLHPDLPLPWRRGNALRWLTSCFADLDIYKAGLTFGQALGMAIDAQDDGIIPPASMFTRSGRGLWLFWILRNEDERYPIGGPVRAWGESTNAYYCIQQALASRLIHLEVDVGSSDASRITRIPGSMHTLAKRRVAHMIPLDESGKGYTYSIHELCDFLKIKPFKIYPAVRKLIDPETRLKKLNGFLGRWKLSIDQFTRLEAIRGGFREGMRFYACRLYAGMLHSIDIPKREIIEAVAQIAGHCRSADGSAPSPLPKVDYMDAVKAGRLRKLTRFRNQRIADILGINRNEAEHLDGWPSASRFKHVTIQDQIRQAGIRKPVRESRRDMILKYMKWSYEHGKPFPTIRGIMSYLESLGLGCAPNTILRDLKAMSLKNPRARIAPPAPDPEDLQTTLF